MLNFIDESKLNQPGYHVDRLMLLFQHISTLNEQSRFTEHLQATAADKTDFVIRFIE